MNEENLRRQEESVAKQEAMRKGWCTGVVKSYKDEFLCYDNIVEVKHHLCFYDYLPKSLMHSLLFFMCIYYIQLFLSSSLPF